MAAKPKPQAITRTDDKASPPSSTQQQSETRLQYQEVSFSGPLPDPAILKAYDLVVPGLAERIVARWEKQSDHRMELEHIVITGDNKRATWGQVSATIISLAVLGVCYVLAINGRETTAAILAGIDLATLAGVFIYGSQSRKSERIEKAKIMTGQS